MDFAVSDKTNILIIGGCMEMPSYGNSSTDLYYRILKKEMGINVSLIQQSPNLIEDVIDKINKKRIDLVIYLMRGLHMCDACKPIRSLKGLGKPAELLNYLCGLVIRRPSKVIEEEISRIDVISKYSRVIVVAPLSSRHFITRYLVKRFQRTFKKRSSIPIIGCDMDADTFFVDGFHLSKTGDLALSKRIRDFLSHEKSILKKEKLKNVILYLFSKLGGTISCKRKLAKLLFYVDFDHFEKYRTSVTESVYVKQKRGPFPEELDTVILEMVSENKIRIDLGTRIFSISSADKSVFRESELNILDRVAVKYGNFSDSDIQFYIACEAPWVGTDPMGVIYYELSYYRCTDFH